MKRLVNSIKKIQASESNIPYEIKEKIINEMAEDYITQFRINFDDFITEISDKHIDVDPDKYFTKYKVEPTTREWNTIYNEAETMTENAIKKALRAIKFK